MNNFIIKELVPKEIYVRWGDKSIWFIDERIFHLINFIRTRFAKPMTINNWHTGGGFNNRGFRTPTCVIGATLSQHRFGRAVDFNIDGVTPQEIYKDIVDNFSLYAKEGLTTIEDISLTIGWTHIDIRYTGTPTLLIVK